MRVFSSSPWIPAEWIRAHGFESRGVWPGLHFAPGPLPLSAGVCAFAEWMLACAESQPDAAIIFASSCDQLRRAFDVLALGGRRQVFLFNLPATWPSPAAGRLYRSEVERLGWWLEELGGCAPGREEVWEALETSRQARARLLAAAPGHSARPYAGAIAHFHWDGTVHLPDAPTPPAVDAIPLAVLGGPLPAWQWDLLDAIEASGGRVVLNATDVGERTLTPRCPMRSEQMHQLDLVTETYFMNCFDVFQRPNTRLYAWLGERVVERGIRGLVLWTFTGCDLWRAEAPHLREALGLPVLLLEADEARGCSPRHFGRLEAFLEMLRAEWFQNRRQPSCQPARQPT